MKKTVDELKKLLEKTGGTVDFFDVPYEVGLSMVTSKDKWESSGAKPLMRVKVGDGADSEKVYKAGYYYLKALVEDTAGEQMKKIISKSKPTVAQPTKPKAPPTGLHVPDDDPPFLPGETRTPLDADGEEMCLMNVESIEIEYTPGGEKRAKVRGKTQDYPSDTWAFKGNYTKHGVVAYKEVLEEIGWDIDTIDAGKYDVDKGYVAIVQIVGDKPKKILGFN